MPDHFLGYYQICDVEACALYPIHQLLVET